MRTRTFWTALLVLLGLLTTPVHARDVFPALWKEAIQAVQADPAFSGLVTDVRWVDAAADESPLSASVSPGRCQLIVRVRQNPLARKLEQYAPMGSERAFLQTIVAHELTHCWRARHEAKQVEQVLRLRALAQHDASLTDQADTALRTEETFADVAALAWAQTRHEEAFEALLTSFMALRADPALGGGGHGTQAALLRIARHGMLYGETPFDAAQATVDVLRARGYTLSTASPKRR